MADYSLIPLSITIGRSPGIEQESGDVARCIDGILDLIVFTPKGSYCADPEFGFEYWNHEFANINVREFNNSYMGIVTNAQSMNDISRKQCELSLRDSILSYEPRLLKPEVKIELDVNSNPGNKGRSKYEMRILISGYIDDGLGVSIPYEKRVSFMVEPVAKKI